MSLNKFDNELPGKQPEKTGKVRKFRRSHKNSRDGCPNCRAKRVKCTEELPACHNCVRKDLRCGYLDFSRERLEHIRQKNEAMKGKTSHDLLDYQSAPFTASIQSDSKFFFGTTTAEFNNEGMGQGTLPLIESNYLHPTNITPANESQSVQGAVPINVPRKRKSVVVKKTSEMNSALAKVPSIGDFRSVIYSNTLNRNLGKNKEEHTWNIPNSVFSESVFFSQQDTSGTGLVDGIDESIYLTSGRDVDCDQIDTSREQFPGEGQYEVGQLKDQKLFVTVPSNLVFDSTRAAHQGNRALGDPLPHASHKLTVFKRRVVPMALRNVIIEQTLARAKLRNLTLKSITNINHSVKPKPVWVESEIEKFWIGIIQQLSTLNLYFVYFLNKAANILVRASSAVVNGDIEISSLPNSSLSSSSPMLPSASVYPSSFFYNQDDLAILARMSYSTFDLLIRSLRESISDYHEEFSAKMSLVSAWGCYFHLVSNIGTFCLMMSGTFALLQKTLTNNSKITDLTCALRREIQLVRHFYVVALYPDYNFASTLSLIECFQNYRNMVQYFIDAYEGGQNFEHDLVRILKDPLFRHEYHETGKFLDRLKNHYFPTFQQIDTYCKQKCKTLIDGNMRFISPNLTFDLAYDWFKVYRGDKTFLSKRSNPLKKTLYVFLIALGKNLAHVFPSLKYMSYVDPCNVSFCKVGFKAPEFDPWNRPRYQPLAPMFMDLIKTIKFFENRLKICAYLANSTLKSEKFITKLAWQTPKSWTYRDVVHVSAGKLNFEEKQLTSMTNCVIQLSNYPMFEEILHDPTCSKLIQTERDRQQYSIHNEPRKFHPDSGMLNHDFDASDIVDQYMKMMEKKSDQQETPIEVHRELIEHMNQCRLEITNAIHDASSAENV